MQEKKNTLPFLIKIDSARIITTFPKNFCIFFLVLWKFSEWISNTNGSHGNCMGEIVKITLTVKTMWNIKLKSNLSILFYLYYANLSPVHKMIWHLNTVKDNNNDGRYHNRWTLAKNNKHFYNLFCYHTLGNDVPKSLLPASTHLFHSILGMSIVRKYTCNKTLCHTTVSFGTSRTLSKNRLTVMVGRILLFTLIGQRMCPCS